MIMNCANNWNKCVDVIHRLSSRIKNEQNQSELIPSCIEKSFYQCKGTVGQACCVEIGGNCSIPMKLSNDCGRNRNMTSMCDNNINQPCVNPVALNRHQFALSKMFDNKRKYIDYVVTSVLRQVVNHISLESLHQLSCCLPEQIEEVLRNVTDIDSDRLVRILVTDVLQSYGNNAGQVTDWYAFANSVKPLLPLSKTKDDGNKTASATENKVLSKSKRLSKDKKSSDRILNNRIKSIFDTTPVSPSLNNKKKSSESIVFSNDNSPLTDSNISSVNRTSPTGIAPHSMSTQSKETYTPVGTKYQSRIKPNRDLVSDRTNEIDYHQPLPFHQKSKSNKPQTQHRTSTDAHHYSHKSNGSSDQSSSSDCVLTIHHKHKHTRGSNHHHHHRHTTTSFDTPSIRSLSSHTSVPKNKLVEKSKQTPVNTSSMSTNALLTYIKPRPNLNLSSVNAKELKFSDLFTDQQILLFKLFASSDNAAKYLHQIENSSFQSLLQDKNVLSADNQQYIPPSMDEIVIDEHSITDNYESSSIDQHTFNVPLNQDRIRSNSEKKILRINHYPNMLADFD